ncbi:MAG: primosomal protein N' [Candidatus Omnitrophica bacterium]|nr:primosomal protein N' [Candidatus Omnitrophota bacterium]
MLFAKVVLGLPLRTAFDYLIPQELEKKAKPGIRTLVPFRNKKLTGYIVGLAPETSIEKVKPIYGLIDETPVLNPCLLKLTRELSDYYLCSWGEAIESALPSPIRKGKPVDILKDARQTGGTSPQQSRNILLHNLNREGNFELYLKAIKETIDSGKAVIFLSPEIEYALRVQKMINEKLGLESALLHSRQTDNEHLDQWLRIKNGAAKIAVGTRLAVFAPFDKTGLIIVDNEGDPSYKQDQTPHYHAREAAFMRGRIEKAKVILGSLSPSLEAIHLAKTNKIEYSFTDKKSFPEITVINMKTGAGYQKQKTGLSYQLQSRIDQAIQDKEKILVFLNRKGFATTAACPNCHKILRCPRCDVNLAYQFKDNLLVCRYCNYKMPAPNLCPDCDASYIRYSGIGTEKIESEFSRLFPAARISRMEDEGSRPEETDILISSRPLLGKVRGNFSLTAVVSIDNSLNRTDFRASEKTYALLLGLLAQTDKKMFIQTYLPTHYCFWSLLNKNINSFYEKELKFRKQVSLPPFSHIIIIKIRGRNAEKVKERGTSLLEKLNAQNSGKKIVITALNETGMEKLRGNFYSYISVRSSDLKDALRFINKNIQDFRHSDIIVTADVDPL